jgi:hypothetical protein
MNNSKKLALIEDIKRFVSKNNRFPTWKEIRFDLGVPRRTVRDLFGNLQQLFSEVSKSGDLIFTKERAESVKKLIGTSKTYFITTAVVGAPVFSEAMRAIKNSFCKHNNALLLVLPAADPASNSISEGLSDFLGENLVFEHTHLNNNVSIQAIKLSAKQVNPTTGLSRFGQRNTSFIFASPKQSLEFVPVSNNKLPHALISTGAITTPDYESDNYLSKRTAYIAEQDHVMGGLIVEVEDDQFFYFRHVQFNTDGSFTDLGVRYYPNGSKKFFPILNLTLGDRHVTSTCPVVSAVTDEMISLLKPKNIVLHDLFNGTSINHHLNKQPITKAQYTQMTLREEGDLVKSDLEHFCSFSFVDKIHIVKSNHDEWIDRYLEEFRFQYDPQNLECALELALHKLKGHDVLQKLINIQNNKIHFLKRDEDLIFNGVQYGCHGDYMHKGMSYDMIERAYGAACVGHKHTAGKRRQVTIVGTSTELRESYARGPISWTNTHEVHNVDGSRQLVNIINGKFRLN